MSAPRIPPGRRFDRTGVTVPLLERPLRVLHVLEATLGGTGRAVPALLRAQVQQGARVGLAYASKRADRWFLSQLPLLAAAGVDCHPCPMDRAIRPWRDAVSAWRLRALVRRYDPDILHLHASKAGMLGRLLFGRRKRPVVVYQPHGFSFLRRGAWLAILYRSIEAATAPMVRACVVHSRAERDAVRRGFPAWPTRIDVVPNIVELPAPDPARMAQIRNGMRLAAGERIAAYVGRLERGKRVDDLIAAVRLVREMAYPWHAVIVGEGSQRRWLERLAVQTGTSSYVHFVGFQTDPQNWVGAADCLVHPSSFEAFGLAVAEAMLVGSAVIASDIPAMRELLDPGVTGLLYPTGRPGELAEHLATFARDPETLRRIAQAGHRQSTRFSAQDVAGRHFAMYHSLMGLMAS